MKYYHKKNSKCIKLIETQKIPCVACFIYVYYYNVTPVRENNLGENEIHKLLKTLKIFSKFTFLFLKIVHASCIEEKYLACNLKKSFY